MIESRQDKIFNVINYTILTLFLMIVIYPLIYIISASFSSTEAVMSGAVWLFPIKPTLYSYLTILAYPKIYRGFFNSIIYTVCGSIISVTLTMLAAYPLSRKEFCGRNIFSGILVFTMLFSGGLIPTYLLINKLKLIDTIWALILPNALAVWNIVITRTFIQSNIPDELYEAAEIDGCNDWKFLISNVIPLSGPIIAVIALFYAVGIWNSYFDALIYLRNDKLFPLQIILRDILVLNQLDPSSQAVTDVSELARRQGLIYVIKYSLIVVASVPLLIVYPFVQKYFVKGVMIGSLKG